MENILAFVIIALLAEIAYLVHSHKQEVDKLTRAVISKNLQELDSSTIINTRKAKKQEEPEWLPLESVSDKKFAEAIKQ